MNTEARKALEFARHQLTTLSGLVVADGEAPEETWEVDESACIQAIDKVLAADKTLAERIESAFDTASSHRESMEYARWAVQSAEHNAKQDHSEEWAAAKNNDVRAVMLAGWLAGEDEYNQASDDFVNSRFQYRLALLEIERLKLLVVAGVR